MNFARSVKPIACLAAFAGAAMVWSRIGVIDGPESPAAAASFEVVPVLLSDVASRVATAEKTSDDITKRRRGSPDDKKPRELTFDDIKFAMERNADFDRKLLTEEIEKLDGKRIMLRGYMLPSFQQDGITQFVLVRDNLECCFGPGAMLFDCLIVDMDEGKSASYSIRPVTVEGVFTIEPLSDEDDVTLAIYHLQAVQVK